jgi:Common central domain of tyrosinase
MAREIRRRSFMQGVITASAAAWAGSSLGCSDDGEAAPTPTPAPAAQTVRKNAGSMSDEEIDRFKRAFEYAVAKGYFDTFNDQHYDHHRNRHHGADVLARSPITAELMATSWGYRLLPWHRSFVLEAEMMLRAALRARSAEEGKDPSEADLLFMPYWDATHEQGLPQWVMDFQPVGGTAIVPPDLPEGHAGYGKAVGERYDIVFGRWPGENLAFETLQTPDYVDRILANETFVDFYDALDSSPELVVANFAKAQAALGTLESKLPGDEAVQTLSDALAEPPEDAQGGIDAINALFTLGYYAAVEALEPTPDVALIAAVKDVFSLFNFMPHIRMHLWAGGLAPTNAGLRGTVTYFQELTVDPVFWMIHGELDRLWYTWEKTNADKPPLDGEDALFNPLTADEGSWYGGGKTYTLDELTRHDALPYTYDALFEVAHGH